MAEEKKQVHRKSESTHPADRARDFWTNYSRPILIACGAVILLGGGWLAYKYLIKAPKEAKASEALWKAEQYFEQDSIQKTLKGDGQSPSAEKVASEYSGTAAGNLADFYAGSMALKAGENDKAVKHLKDFSTDAKQIQARAYKLLGDAYANLGKNADAFNAYKKAAHEFEKDQTASAEYLFFAAYFADRVMNDKKGAIELYKELVQKYQGTQYGPDAQKYLAQAGVYNAEE
jgi:predicted negative regulator of RcsB-dependent stress response